MTGRRGYGADDWRRDRAHRERERQRDGEIIQLVLNERTAEALLRYLNERQLDGDVAEARTQLFLSVPPRVRDRARAG